MLFWSLASLCWSQDNWQFSGDITLSSDYIYRGISLANGATTPQLKISAAHHAGVFASFWLSKADIAGISRPSLPPDWEAEYSLGYHRSLNNDWQLSLSHAWLEYRQEHLPRNADYQETRIHLDYQDHISIFAAHSDSVWNTGFSQTVLSATARTPLPYNAIGALELGLVDLGQLRGRQYSYIKWSIGKPIHKKWIAVVEYHYSNNRNNFFNSDNTGSQFSVSLSYRFPW